jgi:hypothetical protein
MNFAERALYHQVHPLKLVTDIASGIVALALFAGHWFNAGLVVLVFPPALASLYLLAFGRLDHLAATPLGRHVRRSMTPSAQILRPAALIAMCVGAWRRQWTLLIVGAALTVWVWVRRLRTTES